MKNFLNAASLFGFKRWIVLAAIAALVALIAGGIIWLRADENADDKHNQTIGATVEREAQTREVLERTEQANEARETIRKAIISGAGPDPVLYDQCLRSARTPARCERFLPERPADHGGGS